MEKNDQDEGESKSIGGFDPRYDPEHKHPRKCSYRDYDDGSPCPRWAVIGDHRCPTHGGGWPLAGKPRGFHHFKTGHRSRYLPIALAGKMIVARKSRYKDSIKDPTLAEQYLVSLQDEELINVSDEMALIDARNAQLIRRATSGERPETMWEDVHEVFSDLDSALNMSDTHGFKKAMGKMRTLLEEEGQERKAWDEIFERMEQRRKLAETERRRREAMSLMLTAEKAMELVAKLLDAIHEALEYFEGKGMITNALSRQIYLAIAHRFTRITGSADSHVLDQVGRGGKVMARPGGVDRAELLDTGSQGTDTADAIPEGSLEGSVIEG